MAQSASHEHPLELVVVAQPLHDDGDVISTREFNAADRLTETVPEAFGQPFAPLTSHELEETVAHRQIIEQAVRMLVLAYELDADNAVELLKWGSLARSITVRLLAEQLTEDLAGRACDRERPAGSERVDLRTVCDDALFTVHERASPVFRRGREP